ncbi:hypothetical protein A2870_01515 [Candidatus Curtissbacteria bacterium RIFCSPHIGHO2_01_FULL_41_11]|uniref:Uncharacterized protein n=1 Tax=Candidatus Curtissbacteria bacterium RIFCSPHIGHO2_01_FULL_41_11 TaxID=1797711 RepID=A0A1F5G6G2_9BACT|nr:MAG: hypothetical protein A2870_01515 [Candidatus Curtissbacteria bacterium RIFCSPHIGHO2_01_FULL_41_11]
MNELLENTPRKFEFLETSQVSRTALISLVEELAKTASDREKMEEVIACRNSPKTLAAAALYWDGEFLKAAKRLLAGGVVETAVFENIGGVNGKLIETFRESNLPEIIRELFRTSNEILDFLGDLSEEELFRKRDLEIKGEKMSVADFFDYLNHDSQTVMQISLWRAQ